MVIILLTGYLTLQRRFPSLVAKAKIRSPWQFSGFVLVFLVTVLFSCSQVQAKGMRRLHQKQPASDLRAELAPSTNVYPVNTVWGGSAVFSLFDPKNQTGSPALRKALKLDRNPLIFKYGPVYESIQKFISESGDYNPDGPEVLQINNGKTTRIFREGRNQDEINERTLEQKEQTQRQFQQDSLESDEYSSSRVDFVPYIKPFSSSLADARWTSHNKQYPYPDPSLSGGTYGTLLQYPKLDEIKRAGFRVKNTNEFRTQNAPNAQWLDKVIAANPNERGLVGYEYTYLDRIGATSKAYMDFCMVGSGLRVTQYTPYVNFISIYNNSKTQITIKKIAYSVDFADGGLYKLRPHENHSSFFQEILEILSTDSKTKTVDVNVILAPKRSYIIPIEFGFESIPVRQESANGNKKPWRNPIFLRAFRKRPTLSSWERSGSEEVSLSAEFVKLMHSSSAEIPVQRKLFIGPIMNLKSLETVQENVSQNHIPSPRPIQTAELISLERFANIGSCPFLLVYDRVKGYWIDYGKILVDRKEKALQRSEVYSLMHNISRIRIEERDDEVTYIDQVKIVYTDPKDGRQVSIAPPIASLEKVDGTYLVLNKEEDWEFDFTSSLPANATNIQVEVDGYYSPLKSK